MAENGKRLDRAPVQFKDSLFSYRDSHNKDQTIVGPSHLYTHTLSYRKVSNIRRTLVGNKIVDHSDVVGALPVGAAPTTSSFST